jgi:hypothetical protein
MRGILVAFALLALTGCVSDEEAMVQDHGFCHGIGAKGDTYAQCMMQRQNSRAIETQRRRQAYADLSRSIQQQQMINQMNRPKMTTCNQFGSQINCTTF